MTKRIAALPGFIALSLLAGCGNRESIHAAKASLDRLDEYKHASELLFEPRLRDAEKAVEELATSREKALLSSCLNDYKIYRSKMRRLELSADDPKEFSNQKKAFTEHNNRLIQDCIQNIGEL